MPKKKPDEELETAEDSASAAEEEPEEDAAALEEESEEEPEEEDASSEESAVEEEEEEDDAKSQIAALRKEWETEKARLLNETAYFRNLYEETRKGKGKKDEEEEELTVTNEEYYQNPIDVAKRLIRFELDRDRKKSQKEATERYRESMKQSYAKGRDSALKAYPKLFRGIQSEVEQYVFETVRSGRITDPADLQNPETWAIAAESLRRSKGELDFSKYYAPTSTPASEPPFSETPTAVRKPLATPRRPAIDEEARIFIEEVNRGEKKKITDEEIAESMGYATRPRPRTPFKTKGVAR